MGTSAVSAREGDAATAFLNGAAPAVSIVLATRNRAELLRLALESLARQEPAVPFEIVVADNGSTDGTAALVESFHHPHGPVVLCIEPRVGVSYARNAGARVASGAIVAFMDDDQVAAPGWVNAFYRAFRCAHPPDFVGGRNLPPPGATLPEWVSPELRGALSLLDRGDDPLPIDRDHWMTLLGGNMACWKRAFEGVGGFRPYPRSQDRELTVRLLLAGHEGRYLPAMVMYHPVHGRLTRQHFRHWHVAEGTMRAHYRFLERFNRHGQLLSTLPCRRRLAGVSLFVYREGLTELWRWALALARRRPAAAFRHELRARHLFHYIAHAARGASELRA